jgi:transposase
MEVFILRANGHSRTAGQSWTADLVKGKTIGIDATTLEANAALRSIVRRDSGETYQEFLMRLAQASGIETPTRADLARLDRKDPKKGRNAARASRVWLQSPDSTGRNGHMSNRHLPS